MKYKALYQLILISMSGAAIADEGTTSAPIRQCYVAPELPARYQQLDRNDNRLQIFSGDVDMLENKLAQFSSGVELTHRDTYLSANGALFDKLQQKFTADGGIDYYNSLIHVSSRTFEADYQQGSVALEDAQYRFIHQAGRGNANRLAVANRELVLQNAFFTSCPEGDNGWTLAADDININADEGWGEAWNSVIRVKGIPVMYLPYLTFPVNDQRKSGLLFPRIGSSQKRGVDIEVPYYLNLAENYDATITPRLMTERGTQLKTEFRYLTEQQQGELQLEYLPNDRKKADGFGARYLTHWAHKLAVDEQWRGTVDFTDVSDDGYISELGSAYNNQSDTQLYRQAQLQYFGEQVTSKIKLQGFEIIGNYLSPYSALPEIELKAAAPTALPAGFEFDWYGQYVHFERGGSSTDNADRLHFQPSLRLPYHTAAFDFTFETSMLATQYEQQLTSSDGVQTTERLHRVLPRVMLNSKLNFEREASWFGDEGFQTLEPQLQYLYIPYRDQTTIGLFDTARLQDDYFGLFRQNRFSGLDRINDANQVSLGWTTRMYDAADVERLRFSMGQIIYLNSPRTNILNSGLDLDGDGVPDNPLTEQTANESVLAIESQLHWKQRWYLTTGTQYDTRTTRILKSNVALDYRADDKKLFQVNHRYSRDVSGYEIKQLGALGTMPIADQWQAVGSYHRDLTNQRLLEMNVGVQYESCCWAIRLVARRQIQTNFEPATVLLGEPARLDSGISLQFVLKGFGDSAGFAVSDMLSSGIFGYRRPYLLNN